MLVATKLGLAAGAALIAYLAWPADAAAADIDPATKQKAFDAGHADGCAAGAASAKAGQTPDEAVAALDRPRIDAAATASGDYDAYWDGFGQGHAQCYEANKITHDVKPIDPVKPPKTDPKVIHMDRVQGEASWQSGALRGAEKGWVQGITGVAQSTPSGSSMAVPDAYRAGYKCGFPAGLAEAQSQLPVFQAIEYAGGAKASSHSAIPTDLRNKIGGKCALYFPAWWTGYEGTMVSVAGVGVAVGGDARHHYPDNALLRQLAKVSVAGVALVGARRGPRVVRRPGDGSVQDGVVDYADAVIDRHWPAPPPGSAADAVVYRSY